MGIYAGNSQTEVDFLYSSKYIQCAYRGDTLIWPTNLDKEVFTFTINVTDGFFYVPLIRGYSSFKYNWKILVDNSLYGIYNDTGVLNDDKHGILISGLSSGNHTISICLNGYPYLTWLRGFSFDGKKTLDAHSQLNRNKIIYCDCKITSRMWCYDDTYSGGHVCYYLFTDCQNLQLGNNFGFSDGMTNNLKSTGQHFMTNAFQGCTSLTSLPSGFKIPPNIDPFLMN
jgi:hypothetical protein